MKSCSICRRRSYYGDHSSCRTRRRAELDREQAKTERAYFERTGHCGQCGQPGQFCLCVTPCGCDELHEVGSGRGKDAAEVFAETPVIDGQETLL